MHWQYTWDRCTRYWHMQSTNAPLSTRPVPPVHTDTTTALTTTGFFGIASPAAFWGCQGHDELDIRIKWPAILRIAILSWSKLVVQKKALLFDLWEVGTMSVVPRCICKECWYNFRWRISEGRDEGKAHFVLVNPHMNVKA